MIKKLYRCRWDKKLAGVCGGLGQYFRCDPTLIRLITLLLWILTGIFPLAVIYLIAWALLPKGPPTYVQIPCKKLYRSSVDRKICGICGGLAHYFQLDSTVIRILYILGALLTVFFPFLLWYIIASFIIPENPRGSTANL